MIIINNINVSLDTDFSDATGITAKALRVDKSVIKSARIYRKSVDARKKNDVHFCISVVAECKGEEKILKRNNESE